MDNQISTVYAVDGIVEGDVQAKLQVPRKDDLNVVADAKSMEMEELID